jgi:hypothetical protein
MIRLIGQMMSTSRIRGLSNLVPPSRFLLASPWVVTWFLVLVYVFGGMGNIAAGVAAFSPHASPPLTYPQCPNTYNHINQVTIMTRPQGNREGGTVAKGLTRLILAGRVPLKNFEQRPKPNFNDTSRRHRRSSSVCRMSRNRWSRRNECTPKQNWKL